MTPRPRTLCLRTAALAAALAVAGCSDWLGEGEAPPLPGERIPVLMLESGVQADPGVADVEVLLPAPAVNAAWPQAGGYSNHAMYHLELAPDPVVGWSVDIGAGSDSDRRLLSPPVAADGRVYVMDADGDLTALALETGARLWRTFVLPEEEEDSAMSGGVGYYKGRVFATTGAAEVVALNAENGEILWRSNVSGPIRAAPAISGGRVFVVSVDNQVEVFNAETGDKLWSYASLEESAGLLGGGTPAVDGAIAVVPFTNGELSAFRVANGRVLWSDSLAGLRRSDAVAALPDIRGHPVIDRNLVLAMSHSDRLVAVDLRSGSRAWEQEIGGINTPWAAGPYVYVVSNRGEIVCLARDDGRIRWVRQLPAYEDPIDQEDPIRWVGPVLASDRLVVANNLGEVWAVSPYTGDALGRIEVSGGVDVAPVVAAGTLLILTDDGRLTALR